MPVLFSNRDTSIIAERAARDTYCLCPHAQADVHRLYYKRGSTRNNLNSPCLLATKFVKIYAPALSFCFTCQRSPGCKIEGYVLLEPELSRTDRTAAA